SAERKTELEVLDVLRGNRRTRQRHAGCIDPFVLADLASFDDRRLNLGAVAGVDAQLDDAVGEQEAIAGTRVLGQPGERSRQPSGPTDEITRGDPQGIAGVDVQRAADGGDDLGVAHRIPIMGQIVPDAIEHYLADLNRFGDAVLDDIARGNDARGLPLVDAEVGALLRVMATAVGASRILEIGTAIGYSGIWLAGALPPGGRLLTMEMSEERAREARENFARAGVS